MITKSKSFQIGNTTFQRKTDLILFVKGILNKYDLHNCLNKEDELFISCLLRNHPDYVTKVGSGINSIVVKQDDHWKKTRCFHIVRTDGTETDFSYLNCINGSTRREPIKMFKQAARTAVEPQIVNYLMNYNRQCIDKSNHVICEMTKQRIPKEEATVDHIPPLTFNQIVTDFIETKQINLLTIEYEGLGDNEYHRRFKDKILADDFSNYHKRIARLRVISKKENLTQKKKGYNIQLLIPFN